MPRKRSARKKEVETCLEKILGELRPTAREKKIHFEKRVQNALRKMLQGRLNTKYFKSSWLQNRVEDCFQKHKVNEIL